MRAVMLELVEEELQTNVVKYRKHNQLPVPLGTADKFVMRFDPTRSLAPEECLVFVRQHAAGEEMDEDSCWFGQPSRPLCLTATRCFAFRDPSYFKEDVLELRLVDATEPRFAQLAALARRFPGALFLSSDARLATSPAQRLSGGDSRRQLSDS